MQQKYENYENKVSSNSYKDNIHRKIGDSLNLCLTKNIITDAYYDMYFQRH